MTLSVSGSAAALARAPVAAYLQRLSPSSDVERGSDRAASLLSAESQSSRVAGMPLALDELSQASNGTASEEAWARIDTLLNHMRQLTLGGAESATTASTATTTQAITAYVGHSDNPPGLSAPLQM
ncbi:hypothetical protein [Methylosinus sp. Sm6]|uniref:hypothetical protein n=1 Tax=Methylosinus sp. Sm6 TaxID=2866948 RepID=UPI001C9965E1|nr:hypothetical protein [Methylosinus sp. Sm6]MBY6242362.1 hypothetical protein [Methylosinus sp. Sm6]